MSECVLWCESLNHVIIERKDKVLVFVSGGPVLVFFPLGGLPAGLHLSVSNPGEMTSAKDTQYDQQYEYTNGNRNNGT